MFSCSWLWLGEHCNLTFRFCLCSGLTENDKAVGVGISGQCPFTPELIARLVPLIKTTAREMEDVLITVIKY